MKLPDELKNQFSSLILFDGVCNLCTGFITSVIKRDPLRQFRYASLQGTTGQHVLDGLQLPGKELNTMIYIRGDQYYIRSSAALNVLRHMNGLWPLFYALIFIPPPIRDFFYSILAKNRYRWFGKKDVCMIPTPELQDLFLE